MLSYMYIYFRNAANVKHYHKLWEWTNPLVRLQFTQQPGVQSDMHSLKLRWFKSQFLIRNNI